MQRRSMPCVAWKAYRKGIRAGKAIGTGAGKALVEVSICHDSTLSSYYVQDQLNIEQSDGCMVFNIKRNDLSH